MKNTLKPFSLLSYISLRIPWEGEPADVTEIVSSYAEWPAKSTVLKLFVCVDHA
jgi:hypothetical protein